MSPTETTALLPNHQQVNGDGVSHTSFAQKVSAFLKGEGEPGWLKSYKWFFLNSYFNILLVFVPLSVISHHLHWDAALRFTFSFLAIMPLAKVR